MKKKIGERSFLLQTMLVKKKIAKEPLAQDLILCTKVRHAANFLGSQAGVVDINHAFHLYYKMYYVDRVSVDLNLTPRVSSGHSGFLPPQN